MSNKKHDICEVCGKDLIYTLKPEDVKELSCNFCKKILKTNTYCPNGHYICDECHSKKSIEAIEDFCEKTTLKDPFEIADKLMEHPNFKVYGPEHHVLVPAAILTALKNSDIKKPSGEKITLMDIKEAIRRGSKIPGGWCGFFGSCGAGMGSGIAISIFTNATPAQDRPRTLANRMTSRALAKIADDLEHCCKRSVRLCIIEAISFLKDNFDINLDYIPKKCIFSGINDKCENEECFLF